MKQIAVVVAVGLLTRLLVLLMIDPKVGGDSLDYIAMATNQAPSTGRPMGYSAFIALPYLIGGPILVGIAQSFLTIGSAVASYVLLKDRPFGFLTRLLIATSPFLALYDTAILSEALYVPLVWLAWLLLSRKPLIAATLLAWAVLTRETLALLPLCAIPFVARRYWPAFAAASLCAVPAVAQSTTGGLNLWVGTWERDSSWFDKTGVANPQFPPYAFTSKQERARVLRSWPAVPASVAIERIVKHPLKTATAWVERYPRLWLGTRSEGFQFRAERGSALWTALKSGLYALNLLMLGLGLFGLWRHPRYAIPVMYVALVYLPFHAETRYTLLAAPFLLYGVASIGNSIAANLASIAANKKSESWSRRMPNRFPSSHSS